MRPVDGGGRGSTVMDGTPQHPIYGGKSWIWKGTHLMMKSLNSFNWIQFKSSGKKTAVTTNYQNKPPSLFNPSAPPLINLPTSTATPPLCDHSSFLCDHPLIIKRRSLNEWRNTTLSVVTDKHDTYGPKPISGLQFNTPNLFSTFIIYNSIFPYIIKLNSALVESSRKNEGWIDWISRLFNWFNFKDD